MTERVDIAVWPKQRDSIIGTLDAMRKNNFLTDFTLVCEGQEIQVHRTLLCAASPFFYATFNSGCRESLTGRMELPDVPLESAQIILDFLYTGKIPNIFGEREKLIGILKASHLLQLNLLFQHCWRKLADTMSITHFLEIWELSKLYDDVDSQSKVLSFIAKNYCDIISTNEFCDLSLSELIEVTQNPEVKDLPTDVILEGIMTWLKFDRTGREKDLLTLLACVELQHISPYLLRTCLKDTLFETNLAARSIVNEEICCRFEKKSCGVKLLCFGVRKTDSVLTTYKVKKATWSNAISLPHTLKLNEGMATVSLNGNVYFIGGQNGFESSKPDVYKYFVTANKFIRMNDLKVGVTHATAAVLEGCIYVVGGGYQESSQNSVQRFNTVNGQPEMLSATQYNYFQPTVHAFENQIYVLGSGRSWYTDSNNPNAVERYDPVANQWTVMTTVPGNVKNHGAFCNGKLFVLGPHDQTVDMSFHIFDFASCTWDSTGSEFTNFGSHLGPRYVYRMWAADENTILVVDDTNAILKYEINNNKWVKGGKNPNKWYLNLTTIVS